MQIVYIKMDRTKYIYSKSYNYFQDLLDTFLTQAMAFNMTMNDSKLQEEIQQVDHHKLNESFFILFC